MKVSIDATRPQPLPVYSVKELTPTREASPLSRPDKSPLCRYSESIRPAYLPIPSLSAAPSVRLIDHGVVGGTCTPPRYNTVDGLVTRPGLIWMSVCQEGSVD